MELERILKEIERKNYKRVGIQVPEGLKKDAIVISEKIRSMGKEAVIVSSPCFGACDLANDLVLRINCDCLIHVGHSKFFNGGLEERPTYYYEKMFEGGVVELLEKNLDKINENKLGLISTIQHLHELNKIKRFLEKNKKEVFIGEKGNRTKQRGQVLGCDVSSAQKISKKVDSFLFIGSGDFHPLKLLELNKPIYQADPYLREVKRIDLSGEKLKKKEILKVLKYQEEEKWGILLSSKSGQFFPELANNIKEFLEKNGKEVFIFIGNRILESDLIGFGIKIFVNTACPRLAEDFKEVCVVNPWVLKYLDNG